MKIMSFNTPHCLNFISRKIDHIFVSKDVEVVSADISAIVASDHRQHITEVSIAK